LDSANHTLNLFGQSGRLLYSPHYPIWPAHYSRVMLHSCKNSAGISPSLFNTDKSFYSAILFQLSEPIIYFFISIILFLLYYNHHTNQRHINDRSLSSILLPINAEDYDCSNTNDLSICLSQSTYNEIYIFHIIEKIVTKQIYDSLILVSVSAIFSIIMNKTTTMTITDKNSNSKQIKRMQMKKNNDKRGSTYIHDYFNLCSVSSLQELQQRYHIVINTFTCVL